MRCYTCNKFGHVAKECTNNITDSHKWQVDFLQGNQLDKNRFTNTSHIKQKEEEQIKCGLALCSFENEDEWYIDNGCSHHMSGDKNKFESLKNNKDGTVILGNSAPTKVLGKHRDKLGKYAIDALLV